MKVFNVRDGICRVIKKPGVHWEYYNVWDSNRGKPIQSYWVHISKVLAEVGMSCGKGLITLLRENTVNYVRDGSSVIKMVLHQALKETKYNAYQITTFYFRYNSGKKKDKEGLDKKNCQNPNIAFKKKLFTQ